MVNAVGSKKESYPLFVIVLLSRKFLKGRKMLNFGLKRKVELRVFFHPLLHWDLWIYKKSVEKEVAKRKK